MLEVQNDLESVSALSSLFPVFDMGEVKSGLATSENRTEQGVANAIEQCRLATHILAVDDGYASVCRKLDSLLPFVRPEVLKGK
jgi:hypothetical protein